LLLQAYPWSVLTNGGTDLIVISTFGRQRGQEKTAGAVKGPPKEQKNEQTNIDKQRHVFFACHGTDLFTILRTQLTRGGDASFLRICRICSSTLEIL